MEFKMLTIRCITGMNNYILIATITGGTDLVKVRITTHSEPITGLRCRRRQKNADVVDSYQGMINFTPVILEKINLKQS